MMARLEERARVLGEEAQARAVARLAEAARTALPGVEIDSDAAGLTLSGRGLERRLLDDAAFRWIGSIGR